MRTATTMREKRAWFWFIETFIDCVVGKLQGNKSKYITVLSKSVVTISDEAFALLMFENYEAKWHAQYEYNLQKTVGSTKMPRMHGKWTSKTMGQTEFCGWAREGTDKYTALCKRIQAERASEMGRNAEIELLDYLQSTPHGQHVIEKNTRQASRMKPNATGVEAEDAWNEL